MILAVADVVEAMASERPYRSVQALNKAIEEISEKQGLYDPELVAACLKMLEETPIWYGNTLGKEVVRPGL